MYRKSRNFVLYVRYLEPNYFQNLCKYTDKTSIKKQQPLSGGKENCSRKSFKEDQFEIKKSSTNEIKRFLNFIFYVLLYRKKRNAMSSSKHHPHFLFFIQWMLGIIIIDINFPPWRHYECTNLQTHWIELLTHCIRFNSSCWWVFKKLRWERPVTTTDLNIKCNIIFFYN